MLVICSLLLSLFIWGGAARTALDGGGYSLAYQSTGIGTDVASIANPLDCTQTYWPKTDLTLSFWVRCQQANTESYGVGCGTLIFMQNHTATTYGQFFAPILATTATTLTAFAFGTMSVQYSYTLPPEGFFRWNHFVQTYQSSTGNVLVYVNGELLTTLFFNTSRLGISSEMDWCPQGGEWSLTLGRNFFKPTGNLIEEASGRGFEGFWDEISIWNRSLSPSEIEHMYTNKLVGDEPGLLMYYDMNTPDPNVVKNLAFTGSRYDLLLGRTRGAALYFDTQLKTPNFFTKPIFAPNGAPVLRSSSAPPLLVFAVPNNTQSYVLPIKRPTTTSVLKIASVPTAGDLYNTVDGTTAAGSPLDVDDPITHPSGALVWVRQSVFSTDVFNITVDGEVSVVHVRWSEPPMVETGLSYTVAANSTVTMIPLGKDPIGLTWRRKIVSFPETGDLWNLHPKWGNLSTPITTQNPYVEHLGGFLAYVSPLQPIITNYTIVFENEVGLSSHPTLVNLVVSPTNYLPITVDEEYIITQGGVLHIPLTYTDENDDIATIVITNLPKFGKLYHVFPNRSRGPEITESFNPFTAGSPESVWATKVIGVSSYYGESIPYHPNQTLGKPDVFTYGDSPLANSFLTINGISSTGGVVKGGTPPLNYTYDPETWFKNFGYTEYLEWEFGSKSLFAIEFLVAMCRGPGSVVGIKAWSPRNQWETLYRGKADSSVAAARQYWNFRPTICRTNYATNKLRVEYDTRTIGDWAETDAVQFTGTQERISAVLYYDELFDVANRIYRVIYVPNTKYAGNDSFSYQAYDCPFDRFHTRGESWIRINITAIPQPPEVAARQIPVTLGKDQEIKLLASPGRAGDAIVLYTIVQLPQYGKLKVDGVILDHVPYNISSHGQVTYVSNLYVWNEQEYDYFNYTASSVFNTSAVAAIMIPLNPAPGENPVLAWMMLFAIVVTCTLSYVLLFSRQSHYPIRTLSLILNLLVTTATAFTVNIPLHIIMFSGGYSCGFYYWSYMLFPAFFCVAVVCAIYRQRHMFRLERVKKKLARDGNHEDDLEYLRYLKAATSEQRMAIISGLGILVFIIIAAALSEKADSTVGNYYCHSAPVIHYSLLAYWLVGWIAVAAGLYYIRRDFEFTGFRSNIFYLLTYGFLFGVMYILLVAVVDGSDRWHSFALLICLIPLVYQIMAVLRPCFLTFAFLRQTASEEEGLEPLSEIIITQKGFAWFLEFCMVEFSQESPLCWRAIQNFKVKTSYAAMKDIYSKYFAPNAPLAVNLSSRSMKDMQITCLSKNEETPLQELQSIFNLVQVELLHLMQEDSYLRFVASSYYRRFKKGERVPRRENTNTPSTDSGASGTPHGPGSSGSKGSKGSRTAINNQRSLESQAGKEDSKGTSIDPLTGGWAYESGEETTDTSARPASGVGLSNSRHLGLVDLETVRESVDEASPSVGPRSPSSAEMSQEEGPAIEMSTRKTLTAEEHGLRETLIFNSNPLSKRPE